MLLVLLTVTAKWVSKLFYMAISLKNINRKGFKHAEAGWTLRTITI